MNILRTMKEGINACIASVAMGSTQPIMSIVHQIKQDSRGIADMVLGGIMIAILGFAMLFIGLYVTFVIQTSLPTVASATYNSTVTSLNSYVTTVFPVLGLALLIIGFAIIFVALRSGMGGMGGGVR